MFMLAKFLNHLIKRTTMEMCFFKRLCVIFDDFKCVVVLCLKLSNHYPSTYKGIDQNSFLPSSVFTELYTDRQYKGMFVCYLEPGLCSETQRWRW